MKIKVGDKVKFLNDVGGGKVKKIIDKNTIEVLTEDDFEIPMLISEVLIMENNEANEEIETKIEEDISYEVEFDKHSDEVAVFLGFIYKNQEAKEQSDIDYYIINDSNFYFDYNILNPDKQRWESLYKGIIEPNTKFKVGTIDKAEVQNYSKFYFQGYFFRHFRHELKPVVNNSIDINVRKFFQLGSFKENDFFEEDAIIYTVIEEDKLEAAFNKMSKADLNKVIKEKEVLKVKKPSSQLVKEKQNALDKRIVDLHITELIDDENGLEAKDILDIQMKKFHDEMDFSIHNSVNRIVFIHGIGNGRLKMDVRKELDRKYKKYEYQDASFAEYGYGATLVILGR
ncbi:MAG: DUF2027 domain-containing protein [Bacteroidales bacterium]|nr:DUF2027 domain-containing protein [Bacteroidales bacterium]